MRLILHDRAQFIRMRTESEPPQRQGSSSVPSPPLWSWHVKGCAGHHFFLSLFSWHEHHVSQSGFHISPLSSVPATPHLSTSDWCELTSEWRRMQASRWQANPGWQSGSDMGSRASWGSLKFQLSPVSLWQQVALVVKNPPAVVGDLRCEFDYWVGKIPWRRAWQPTPVFLPGESHGQRSLVGYRP